MSEQQHNLHPHKEAVIAMWLFGSDYAKKGLGSMDYYNQLEPSTKKLIGKMLSEIEEAQQKEGGIHPEDEKDILHQQEGLSTGAG